MRGTQKCTDFDPEKFSGVVSVDFEGRPDVNNAIGAKIAKCVYSREEDRDIKMPGRIISQKNVKGGISSTRPST